MKKIFCILLAACLTFAAVTAAFADTSTGIKKKTESIATKAGQPGAVSFRDTGDFGILTPVIPENRIMLAFIIQGAPTWQNTNGDSDLEYNVYVWAGDYDATVNTLPIVTGEVLDHKDNRTLIMDFGVACMPGQQYLIVCSLSNDGNLGYYSAEETSVEGWDFFVDGDDSEYIVPGFSIMWGEFDENTVLPTPNPTKEPPAATEVPVTAAPTEAPTDVPTDAPTEAPTDAEGTDSPDAPAKETDQPADKKGCGGMLGGGFAAVLAVSVLLLKKKEH